MRRFFCAQLALALCLNVVAAASAEDQLGDAEQAFFIEGHATQDATEVETADVLGELDESVELTQFSTGLAGGGYGSNSCTGQCFVGAEYLHVRANFSQAISYITQDLASSDPGFTYNQFDFDYGSSFRLFGGYRICDCGCEFRFTYTTFDSDAAFQSPEQPADGSLVFTAPFEVITGGPGDSVLGSASLSIDDFDFGFSKTIPLGSPLGCDPCCGECCDDCCGDCCSGCGDSCGCGGCWCPAWDITWTGAIRFADVDSQLNYASNIVSTSALPNRNASSTLSFSGVGLRTGVLGRRYCGKNGMASLYMKGDISLLVGDLDYSAVGSDFARHSISCTHVIPVTEIEAGGTVFLTKCLSVSGGYMFAAWHDLGHRPEYDFGGAGVQLESWDDANILGLDGFFVRAEAAW